MTKRHVGNLYRPSSAPLDDRGQSAPTVGLVAANVFYEQKPLRGRELELARQVVANASVEIRFFVDQSWGLDTECYLVDKIGGEQYNIGAIDYDRGIRREAICTCGVEA